MLGCYTHIITIYVILSSCLNGLYNMLLLLLLLLKHESHNIKCLQFILSA